MIRKAIGATLLAVLTATPEFGFAQQAPPSQTQPPASQTQTSPAQPTQQPQVQPPIPGQPTMPPINRNQLPETPAPETSNPTTPAAQAPPPAQPVQSPTEPTGTAAAESLKPSGDAASRPAGAAIAPPKQHQVRSLLIKVGFVAGAAVALGTVYALSTASPSRVPNTTH